MGKLKVWGGLSMVDRIQKRTIVATKTKKRAVELVGTTMYDFNRYWGETGNVVELNVALNQPETVFVCEDKYTANPVYIEKV